MSQRLSVRMLYVASPPTSHHLLPGDRAIEVTPGDDVMMALVSGEGAAAQSCARFNAPQFIVKMIDEVATGTVGQPGTPL